MENKNFYKKIFSSCGNDSENNNSTTKPTTNMWDSGTKRKVKTEAESPRKKLKGAREAEVVVIGTKRKNTEQDPPCKKLRSGEQEATSSGCSSSQPVRATKKKAQIDKSSDTARPEEVILIESSRDSGLVIDKDISEKSSTTSKPAEATERRTVYEVDIVVSGGLNGNYTFTSAPINSLVGSDGEVIVNTVKEDTEAAEEDVTDDFEEKYLLLQKLGQGGFGSVYAGIRKTDKRPVAIKRVQRAVKRKPMIVNGRMRMVPIEVYLMLKATDGQDSETKSAPVALLDWYDRKGEVIVVMERPVPCMDLLNYLLKNRGSLEEDLVKNIMKQLVDAAKEMHSRGILHRDLKLENLLIESSSDGPRVRIIDFGCGCIARRKPYSTFSGTVSYVPPEMWRMGMYKAGPTTVWQLGAILFEMVDGRKRFNTLNFCRYGLKISGKLSEDCQDFLKMCLFKNPDKRATLDQLQQHRWFR